jgi:hypothetical protein
VGINDVSRALKRWLQPLIATRTSGSFVDGRWVENNPQVLDFYGVPQNAEPDDLKVLDEGLRTQEAIKIHTTLELIPQVGETTTGDVITYKDKEWLVYNVAHRYIGNYHKAIAIRQ